MQKWWRFLSLVSITHTYLKSCEKVFYENMVNDKKWKHAKILKNKS